MYTIEAPKSSHQIVRRRRRYNQHYFAIATLIRSIFREVCSCLSGIFVLKLNFVHTTKTSLNPTKVVLVNCQKITESTGQQLEITELPPDSSELPDLSEYTCLYPQPLSSSRSSYTAATEPSEPLIPFDSIIQTMITEKNRLVACVQDGFNSLVGRVMPALSKFGLLAMAFCVVWHQTLTHLIIYPIFRLLFGTLYPAYASYKAVKTKNVKEYVKWMMYWIVFALFTCAETFTDVFLSWFPFYYEIKIILVIWLLSPATKGSSILYRKFVHPMLSSREQEIDEYISKAKEQSYKQVLDLGSKGVNALMQTAIKGGGGLVNQIRKSYSLSDLSEQRHEREYEGNEETDSLGEPRVIRRRHSPRRHSPRRHTTTSAIYFSEIDVRHDVLANIQTADDISSGYSSGEVLHGQPPKIQAREALVRTGSIGSSKLKPTRVTRSTVPKKSTDDLEYATESTENVIYLNDKAQFIDNLETDQKTEMSESMSSEEEFRDCIEHDGNVDFSPSNTLNSSQTPDINFKDVMHENLESSVEICKSVFLKDSEIKNDILKAENLEETKNSNLEIKVTEETKKSNFEIKIADVSVNHKLNAKDLVQDTESISDLINKDQIQSTDESNQSGETEEKGVKKDRGGKYNKPVAPPPPPQITKSDFDLSAIKATLILKPGVVKSVPTTSSNNEIFCHSPKLKRRSLQISPSISPIPIRKLSRSPNRSKSKLDASLSRLKMLPKKIGFWHKDDSVVEEKKRTSWYDTLDVDDQSKQLSKSDDDISKLHAREKLMNKIKSLREETKTHYK